MIYIAIALYILGSNGARVLAEATHDNSEPLDNMDWFMIVCWPVVSVFFLFRRP